MQPQPSETDLLSTYRSDLVSYCADCLVIRTKSSLLIPFEFNNAQRIVALIVRNQLAKTGRVRIIILKARQEGISTWTAARFFRRVTLYENQRALVIADQRKRGQELFGIYELFDRKAPDHVRPSKRSSRRGWELYYDTVEGAGLNSRLSVETAMDAAAGRGSTIQAVHASELAFWEKPEAVWTALMQAVPDQGSEVVVESTANGVGNMFEQMWQDAENEDSSFVAIFLPWWVHEEYVLSVTDEQAESIMDSLSAWEEDAVSIGFELSAALRTAVDAGVLELEHTDYMYKLSVGQLAWRRATIRDKLHGDENLFKQEYPATAREAFLVSGNCFFDEDVLEGYERRVQKPIRFHPMMKNGAAVKVRDPKGSLRVFEEPKPDGEYVIFADTATGRKSGERDSVYTTDREQGGRDFSAAWVYDTQARQYVAIVHGRMPPEVFARQLNTLGYLYSHPNRRTGNRIPALVGVERNHSSGETVVRILKDDLSYPNLYMDRQMNSRRNRMTQAAGWVTTEAKRAVMLDDFAAWLREHVGALPDADTIRECYTFIRDDTGKPQAQEGCHDDRVIAAAGCLQMARHHRAPALPYARTAVRRGGTVGHIEYEEAIG